MSGLDQVAAFRLAYSLTRPLGASFADWLGVPAPYGDGLQLGTGRTSLAFGIVLVGMVAVLAVQRRRADPERTASVGSASVS